MTSLDKLVIMDVGIDDIRRVLEQFLKPTAEHKQAQKRDRILLAAQELFVTLGYRKTSVADVARSAGVAKGTVYLYYSNKAELLLHAVLAEQLDYLSAFAPLFDPALAASDRLRGYIALGIIWSQKLPLLARFTSGDHELELVLSELDAPILECVREAETDIAMRLIDAATNHELPPGALQQRASIFVNLVFTLVTSQHLINIDLPIEAYAQQVADVLVQGVIHAPADTTALNFIQQVSAVNPAHYAPNR